MMDEALLSISPASRGQLVKMLNHMTYYDLILHTYEYTFQHCLDTGMQTVF